MHAPNTQKGFSLVETFVAMTILLVAIVGPMTIAQRGLQSAFFAGERMTAIFLAQEAVEEMRNWRDSYMLDGEDWVADARDSLPNCFIDTNPDGCDYDFRAPDMDAYFLDCGDSVDACRLYFEDMTSQSSSWMYHHDSTAGELSPYTRTIQIEEVNPGIESVVRVEVSWYSSLFQEQKSVVLIDHLLNYDI